MPTPNPEPREVSPGLLWIPLRTFTLPPATHTNTYLLGGEEAVVVDPATSIPEEQERLLELLRARVDAGIHLREIWLTHHHGDHVGAVARVREAFGLPVAAHRLTAEALGGKIEINRAIEDGELTTLTGPGDAGVTWVALHTPGHARGHLCFHAPERGWLLTGDNVVAEGTVVVAAPDGDMTDYLATLERLRALGPSLLLPGHGAPIEEADARIAFYIAHRLEREAAILAALEGAARTPAEIVPLVYTDVDPRAFPLAELNVRSHLAKLRAEGRVLAEGDRYVQR